MKIIREHLPLLSSSRRVPGQMEGQGENRIIERKEVEISKTRPTEPGEHRATEGWHEQEVNMKRENRRPSDLGKDLQTETGRRKKRIMAWAGALMTDSPARENWSK